VTDSCSILVVDDESESLALLTGILTAEGYQVRAANSSQLALESVAAWLPQLILLDIRMPGMDGFEVCRQLKACEKTQDVPLMFISAAREVEERVAGLALGAVDYITKPFQRAELLARVQTHLELGRLRAQLESQVSERTIELRATIEWLRESEERFRNMADTAPVMIWVSDANKLCTFVNQPWLTFTGRTLELELDNGWAEDVHPDDLEGCFGTYSSSFDLRQNFQMEYRLRRADGEYRWVLDKGVPRFAPGGVFVGYIGSAIDITDLKRTQEEGLARQKLESLAVLTRGIAHDFNNLMGSILAEAELAETNLAEGSPPGEEIQQIKAVATRASEVVRELMIYSGQERGNLETVDLSRLVEEMLGLLKVSISKHATLNIDLCEHLPPVWGNATQIRQMVMNLIINASQAIGDKDGVIYVRTSRAAESPNLAPNDGADSQDNNIRLEISDTGCGMTEAQKAKIFDPFFTTKPGGHGLGLAVVHGIVQSNGGVINVVSTPGGGTTFEVLLPCAERRAEIASPAVFAPTPEEPSAMSGTVLLVEDEDTLRLATATALRKKGFSVLAAIDGRSAVEIFRAHAEDIEVVLLDLTLPGISGLEVFRQIRLIKPGEIIVVTSAYDQKIAGSATSCEQPARFLRKPYRFSDLMRLLQEARSETSQATRTVTRL
jgi:two-component system, cell cycle sensor histidine kinase and response regulator CckA